MAMKSMKMPDDGTLLGGPQSVGLDKPEYCPGTCLYLGPEALSALGLESLPAVGTEVLVLAKAVVRSCDTHQSAERGVERRLELQLTDIQLSPAAEEGKKSAAQVIYMEDN